MIFLMEVFLVCSIKSLRSMFFRVTFYHVRYRTRLPQSYVFLKFKERFFVQNFFRLQEKKSKYMTTCLLLSIVCKTSELWLVRETSCIPVNETKFHLVHNLNRSTFF